ncbi:MAG: DUF4360 domain-containing protein [Myxococcaceae bacterium]
MTVTAETEIQAPVYAGSGCEAGTIEPFFGSEREMIYFGTPAYKAEAGKQKNCMLVLPVQAAPKTKVAIVSLKVKTSSALLEDSNAVFQAELFMAGLRTPAMNILFEGPLTTEDTVVLIPEDRYLIWSGCGQSANLRVNSSLTVTDGSVQVVSLRVRLKTVPC